MGTGGPCSVTKEFLAYVLDYDKETKMAKLQIRNNFKAGEEAEVFGPGKENLPFITSTLYDRDGIIVEVAKTPMQILYMKIEHEVKANDMIRRILKEKENVY